MRAAAGDDVSHTMCRLCAIEYFVVGLVQKGRAYLQGLTSR